jgi:dephospho-CoA kinase
VSTLAASAGPIATGKSTLAQALADRWSCPRASFGALVVHEAMARAAPTDRDALQALGSTLIDELGWPEFCRRTMALAGADWSTAPLVIDGVRHRAALETLVANHAARSVLLVYVTCDPVTRQQRQIDRGASVEDVRRWAQDPTERELKALKRLADTIVGGDQPTSEAVVRIESALEERRAP